MNRRTFLQTGALAFADIKLPRLDERVSECPDTSATELYVAVNGSDRNTGTLRQPFATLQRAQVEVRRLKHHAQGRITVWVRGGTHYLGAPLVLGPEDSGTATEPIVYASYPGEIATLSGGSRLACDWRPYKDRIVRCSLRQSLIFTQLFVNGKRRIRARYPSYDRKNPLVEGTGYIDVDQPTEPWPPKQFHYNPKTFTRNRWKKPQEAVVHLFPLDRWGNLQWEVQGIDWEDNAISLGWGGFQINELLFGKAATGIGTSQIYSRGFKSRFFVENVFEELNSPSEWYFDRDEGMLYYIPEPDEKLETSLVEVPFLEHVVEFRGSQRQPVQFVAFSGFRIAHTASTFLNTYEAPSLGDWTIHRGGSVFLEGTRDCGVINTFFDQVGGNGVFLNNYNRRTRIYGNRFAATGDSAICLVGCEGQVQGTHRPLPSENFIANNLIHDCGYFGKQSAGVFLSVTERNTISHNRIFNLPRAAICMNDGWGAGHLIEFNHIHDTVRETTDHGPFNSWGRGRFWCMEQSHGEASHRSGYSEERAYPFFYAESDGAETILRNNLFQEPQSIHQLGIDLDDGSSHYHIYNNLCVGIGVKLREGDYRVVENNIFFHPSNPPSFHQGYEVNHDRFTRNIVVTISAENHAFGKSSVPGDFYQVRYPPLKGPIAAEIDNNLFFNDLGSFFASITPRHGTTRTHYSFEDWKGLGYDEHSVYADPNFVDSANGNFALKSDSPASKIGFTPFDLSSVGLLDDFPPHWRQPIDNLNDIKIRTSERLGALSGCSAEGPGYETQTKTISG